MNESMLLLNDDLSRPLTLETRYGTVALFSRRAPGRLESNEDSALVVTTDQGVVLAVADGAGGCAEGERASRIAIETLGRHLTSAVGDVRTGVLDAFEEANAEVLALATGAATTLSVIQVSPGAGGIELRSYHAGDSSVLVTGGRGRIKLNTVPHSPVGYAVEAGLLDPQDALHHSDLNLVSNMVGLSDMRIELGSSMGLAVRDTVVIGTDGLFDNLHHFEIIDLVRKGPLGEAAARLIDLTTSRMETLRDGAPSKPDDLTFALFRPNRQAARRLVPDSVRRPTVELPRPAAVLNNARLSA